MRGNQSCTRRELRDWLTDELAEWEGGAQRDKRKGESCYQSIIYSLEIGIGQCEGPQQEWTILDIVPELLGVLEKTLPDRKYVTRCRAEMEELVNSGNKPESEGAIEVNKELQAPGKHAEADKDLSKESAVGPNGDERVSEYEPVHSDRATPPASIMQSRCSDRLQSKKRPASNTGDEDKENEVSTALTNAIETARVDNRQAQRILLRMAEFAFSETVTQLPAHLTFYNAA
ncbi:hypothetical protein K491DRAFT_711258 [Lophiostoma macrostomum CBS 122681]|uniref:Uncharacterized protein n=1 Tax=Lophiostoma macrostomum CBS 122681 TaxID=1314788 RepID=A0A6A6TLS4_9PLEO|nr:hypothetical protein K491DRAFT_711258 [Lophiostoma macrostomum CBS 122681]